MNNKSAERANSVSSNDPQNFDWPLAFEAEKMLRGHMDAFLAVNHFARRLSERMQIETGTDFFEWIDHLILAPENEKALHATGFVIGENAETPQGEIMLHHPRATLPRVVLRAGMA